jgi:hypothetical protein
MDYLMDSMEYLKTGDLEGWKLRFQPKVTTTNKRLRQAPSLAPVIPLPNCSRCDSQDVIDDVPQGQYVCVNCGLIQQQGVFMGGPAHCSMERLMNTARVHIHRYSRVVHFLTTIRLMQADSHPMIGEEDLSRLRLACDGSNRPTAEDVTKGLRKIGLARKLRRHKHTLVVLLGGQAPDIIDASIVLRMLKLFRRLEYFWGYHKEIITPGRRVFFSYPFVFYQFCHQLGQPQLTGPRHLLKNKKLSQFQFDSYERSCAYTGFQYFPME